MVLIIERVTKATVFSRSSIFVVVLLLFQSSNQQHQSDVITRDTDGATADARDERQYATIACLAAAS